MMGRKIVLTGGGTAGHVTANLALLPHLKEEGWDIRYIGSYKGIEGQLVQEAGVPYFAVDTGKLRRYKDIKNLTDPFRVLHGLIQAYRMLGKWRPDIVFSKGGFVAVPVVWAAAMLGIPVVCHESDMTPGLANRLTLRFAKKICCSFPETCLGLPREKAVLTGAPIRAELLSGSREEGIRLTGFSGKKPVLMTIGGSLGSVALNEALREQLDNILKDFDIVHICGKGNLKDELSDIEGYRQYEYVREELKELYALADIVISRAGANVICELLQMRKPNLLIPLPREASRGDQLLNAASFEKQGFSRVLDQHELEENKSLLFENIRELYENRESYIISMEGAGASDGASAVYAVLKELSEAEK